MTEPNTFVNTEFIFSNKTMEETKEEKRKRVLETFDTLSQGWDLVVAPAVQAYSEKTIRVMKLFKEVRLEAMMVATKSLLGMKDEDFANDLDARNNTIALKMM